MFTDSGVFRISKRGAEFSRATSAHTKGFSNYVFQIIPMVKKKLFAKGGLWPNDPLNMPLFTEYVDKHLFQLSQYPH